MILFLDLGAAYRELKPEIDAAVSRVLESGWYILGPEVEALEAEWAAYCDAKHRRACQWFRRSHLGSAIARHRTWR